GRKKSIPCGSTFYIRLAWRGRVFDVARYVRVREAEFWRVRRLMRLWRTLDRGLAADLSNTRPMCRSSGTSASLCRQLWHVCQQQSLRCVVAIRRFLSPGDTG